MALVTRHVPARFDDFVGNYMPIRSIMRMVRDPGANGICLLGPSGSGKTVLTRLATEGFDTFRQPPGQMSSGEFVACARDFVMNRTAGLAAFATGSAAGSVDGARGRRKAVIFDDMDTYDKPAITHIVQLMSTVFLTYGVFVVGTCNVNDDRKLVEFKKQFGEIVRIAYPSQKETFRYLLGLDLDCDDARLRSLVEVHDGNVREVLVNVEVVTASRGRAVDPFKDSNIFETVNAVFHAVPQLGLDDMISSIKDDVAATTYMMYENLPDRLASLHHTNDDYLGAYLEANDTFIKTCIVDRHVSANMDWALAHISDTLRFGCLHGCLALRHDTGVRRPRPQLRFSQVLSKVSHRNMMHVKMLALATRFGMSINMLLLLCDTHTAHETIRDMSKEEQGIITVYRKYFCAL